MPQMSEWRILHADQNQKDKCHYSCAPFETDNEIQVLYSLKEGDVLESPVVLPGNISDSFHQGADLFQY